MIETKDRQRIESLPEVLEEWRHTSGCRIQRNADDGRWTNVVTMLLTNMALGDERRSRAVTRLAILYTVSGLTTSEASAFAETLWGQLDERMLPKGTDLLDLMWLRLPAPTGMNPIELLRQMFLRKDYPGILIEHDGKQRMSSANVSDFANHLESIEECSRQTFHYLGERHGIEWTQPEANVLLGKLEQWTAVNATARHRDHEMFQKARTAAMSLLMHVLVFILSSDLTSLRRMIAIANTLERTDRRMTAINFLRLLAGDGSAEVLGTSIIDALYDLTSSSKDRVEEAGDVLLLWLSCADSVLTDAPSTAMIGRIVVSLVSIRHTKLEPRLTIVSHLLRWFPGCMDSSSIDALERTLDYLADVTTLTAEIPSEPAARSEARGKPALRAAAAHIAFRLLQLYNRSSQPVSSIVERWRALVELDPLPEVRRAWSDSNQVP